MAEFNWFKANASNLVQAGTTLLDFYGQYQNSKIYEAQGEIAETMANIEARSMERRAQMAENQGVRAAERAKYEGRVAISDSIAAMAAQGGGVDPNMIAKLKARADYNAMSAVFDARTVAMDLRMQAGLKRIEGKFRKSQLDAQGLDVRQAATTTAIGSWPRSWAQNPNKPGGTIKTGGTYRATPNVRGFTGGF